jgi:hypothetical protein
MQAACELCFGQGGGKLPHSKPSAIFFRKLWFPMWLKKARHTKNTAMDQQDQKSGKGGL